MTIRTLAATGGAVVALATVPAPATAHLHPFNPAAACAPSATGAGNEAEAFFTAPGVQKHWEIVDLVPEEPGTQFLIQLSNPGGADESSGAIAPPGIFLGNPGTTTAPSNCARPQP
jgi:hypothetical protein